MKLPTLFLSLASLICLSSHVISNVNPANPNRMDYLEASIDDLQNQVAILKSKSGGNAINPPAGPNISNGCDFYITGDLLYWKASETGLEYATKSKILDLNSFTLGNGEVIKPHFDRDLGFRVGIGWNTNHDNWDLYLSWTRIHTAAHGHTHANSRFLFSLFADNFYGTIPSIKASAHLKIHLNNLNLELGRAFYVGRNLSIRPHIGLENIWISQHYNTKYQGHSAFLINPVNPNAFNRISFRNHFWGIGIRAGLDTEWELTCGFSLVGNVAWSLLYGDFNLKRTTKMNQVLVASTSKAHFDEGLKQACASMDLALGFQWDYMFAHDQFHLGWWAGWEQHIYFDQNQMFNLSFPGLSAARSTTPNTNLTFQGLTTGLRLDF